MAKLQFNERPRRIGGTVSGVIEVSFVDEYQAENVVKSQGVLHWSYLAGETILFDDLSVDFDAALYLSIKGKWFPVNRNNQQLRSQDVERLFKKAAIAVVESVHRRAPDKVSKVWLEFENTAPYPR